MAVAILQQISTTSLHAIGQKYQAQFAALTQEQAFEAGRHFFAVSQALAESQQLVRAITDPSANDQAKIQLVKDVLKPSKSPKLVVDVVADLALQKWSRTKDLFLATCEFGFNSVMISLSKRPQGLKALEKIEAELFIFHRSMKDQAQGNPELTLLRDYLSSDSQSLDLRLQAVQILLGKKVDPATVMLAQFATMMTDGGRYTSKLETISNEIAASRGHKPVHICSSIPLSSEQQKKIEELLERKYQQKIHINVVINPALLGGMKIITDETVFDSTIESQLADFEYYLHKGLGI